MLNKIPDVVGDASLRPTEIYLTMAFDAILNISCRGMRSAHVR
jgi:hypothetical protein